MYLSWKLSIQKAEQILKLLWCVLFRVSEGTAMSLQCHEEIMLWKVAALHPRLYAEVVALARTTINIWEGIFPWWGDQLEKVLLQHRHLQYESWKKVLSMRAASQQPSARLLSNAKYPLWRNLRKESDLLSRVFHRQKHLKLIKSHKKINQRVISLIRCSDRL